MHQRLESPAKLHTVANLEISLLKKEREGAHLNQIPLKTSKICSNMETFEQ